MSHRSWNHSDILINDKQIIPAYKHYQTMKQRDFSVLFEKVSNIKYQVKSRMFQAF